MILQILQSLSQKRTLEYLAFVLILIPATVLNCYRIAEPAWDWAHSINYGGALDGWHGGFLCEWAGVARNYLKFNYPETGLGQAAYRPQDDPTLFHHRIDHPPLLPLLASLSFLVFGVHEWSARLIPLLSSTGLLLLVFLLGRKLGGTKVALAASFFFALLPMQVYYSTLFFPHTIAPFFSFSTFAFYLWWVEKGETKYYTGIYVSFILGALADWVTYFVVPPILLHYLVCEYRKTRNLKFMLSFALMPFVFFGTHLGWSYILGGKWALEALLDRFLIKTVAGGSAEGRLVFTMWDLYTFGYTRAKLFLTPIACFLSVAWFIGFVITPLRRESPRPLTPSPRLNSGGMSRFVRGFSLHNPSNRAIFSRRDTFVLSLFLFGFSHNLVFGERVYHHDIVMFLHLTPFFAIAAALGMQFIVQKVLRDKWIWTVPFVLIVCYLFISQSASALEWLFDVPVLPEMYIVGSKVNEITDENAKVVTSSRQNSRIRWYSGRVWEIVNNLQDLTGLLQTDPSYSHYAFDNRDPLDRELKEHLVRNHPAENFFNYSFFDLRTAGSNVIVQDPQIQHLADVNFDDKLMLLGYNVEEVVQKERGPSWLEKYLIGHAELLPQHRTTFRITYFWQCLEEMERDYTLVTQFEGYHGKAYRIDHSHQGVNGAYPTSMWQVGEIIREEYQVEVPADYPPTLYALWVGVRDGEEGLNVTSDVEADEEHRVRLGEIEILPAEEPTPLAAEPRPQNKVEEKVNDELMFLGYLLANSEGDREGLCHPGGTEKRRLQGARDIEHGAHQVVGGGKILPR